MTNRRQKKSVAEVFGAFHYKAPSIPLSLDEIRRRLTEATRFAGTPGDPRLPADGTSVRENTGP